MLRPVAFLSYCVLLTGCISFGPRDGQLYVMGSAPSDSTCLLDVTPVGFGPSTRKQTVSGSFRESFVIGPSRRGHIATLTCNGAVVASRSFKYGRDIRIGGELALTSSSP